MKETIAERIRRTTHEHGRMRSAVPSRGLGAIPTVYRGVQYRSRLEARWASMFDRLGWKYAYEPFDMHGWIPDFVLLGVSRLLVEVKPIDDFAAESNAAVIRKIEAACAGTEHAATEKLILGYCPMQLEYCWAPALGVFGERTTQGHFNWDQAAVVIENDGVFDVCAEIGSHAGRLALGYLGGNPPAPVFELVQQFWVEAGNEVQWRSPVRR